MTNSDKSIVYTELAPHPVGAYSQAVVLQGLMYVSGQIALDPESGSLILDDIESETHRVLQNLKAVLEAGGASLDSVIKVSVFVTNMADFEKINGVYGEYFKSNCPARALVEVSALPKGVHVEMEAIAHVLC